MAGDIAQQDDDLKTLHELGYAQELSRRMGFFQNFAISFSIICIIAGGITAFPLSLSAAGGASLGIGWPIAGLFAMLVALSLAQIASAYPTAGAIYHWASILGNKGFGWAAAWFNLLGILFALASINFGAYLLFKDLVVAGVFGVDVSQWGWWTQTLCLAGLAVAQALINHMGIKVTTILTDFSGYLILATAVILTAALLYYTPHFDFARLFTFDNFTGTAGGGVWPVVKNSACAALMLGLLHGIYTITGFDASGHTSEETRDAAHQVPKGMIHSVLWSVLFGYVMVCAFVLALPSVADGAAQGWNAFPWMMSQSPMPSIMKDVLMIAILVANLICGLAALTSGSRMFYAFARDGGVPFLSGPLRKVCKTHRTPANAIWAGTILSFAATLYGNAFTVLSAACTLLLYVSYVMPIAAGFYAENKSWTKKGPFHLGALSKPVAFLSVAGCSLLVWIGVQAPNEKVGYLLAGILLALLVIWFSGERKRFAGPPVTRADVVAKQGEIAREEQELESND